MYIHDVIESLRATDLEIKRKIDALRLDLHMLETSCAKLTARVETLMTMMVSRETEADGNGTIVPDTLF